MTETHDAIATWTDFEGRLAHQRYSGSYPAGSLLALNGPLPVLVTAPHAVAHTRSGRRKGADVATGGLALVAATHAGARGLVATGYQEHDGNFVPQGPFKELAEMMRHQVSACIDVHGFPDSFGSDICLGTGARPHESQPLLELAQAHFTAAGFTVSVDSPYDARRFHTMTSAAQRAGRMAVQVEVARWLRRPFDDPEPAHAMAAALAGFVELAARV